MHEISLVQSLLYAVGEEARARGAGVVRRVRLRVGEVAGVEIDLLRTWYDVCRAGTVCAEAELEVERVAERWECPACGAGRPSDGALACATCGIGLRLVAGDELALAGLDLEVPDV